MHRLFEITLNKLKNDTKIALDWFNINSMVANPAKFQVMFLGKRIDNNQISFQVGDKILKTTSDVKLLGIIK